MKADTRMFGEIEIADDKLIVFADGIIGFPELKKFTLIYDSEKKKKQGVMWMQSMDDPTFALPVLNPLDVKPDYDPVVDDDKLGALGELKPENTYILVTLTVPADIEQMSVNLKAPLVVNTDELKGAQLIIEDDYPVKYKIYEILDKNRKAGE